MTGDEREQGRPLTPGEIAAATGLTQAREIRGKGGRVLKSNAVPVRHVPSRAELALRILELRTELQRLVELTPSGHLMWRAEDHEGRRPSMVHSDWAPETKRLLRGE
jgi:hypothetical protein